jgi:hypothetical protein
MEELRKYFLSDKSHGSELAADRNNVDAMV